MNEKIVVAANGYDRLDGRNAYHSDLKRMTLGAPALKENQAMQIAAQLWTAQEDGTLKMSAELPIHQVFVPDDRSQPHIAVLQGGIPAPAVV